MSKEAEKLALTLEDKAGREYGLDRRDSLDGAALLRRQAEQIKELRRVLDLCLEVIWRADTAAGHCCCGESIDGHADPTMCGHSPVDAGDYAASHIVAEARAALSNTKEAQ